MNRCSGGKTLHDSYPFASRYGLGARMRPHTCDTNSRINLVGGRPWLGDSYAFVHAEMTHVTDSVHSQKLGGLRTFSLVDMSLLRGWCLLAACVLYWTTGKHVVLPRPELYCTNAAPHKLDLTYLVREGQNPISDLVRIRRNGVPD